MQQTAAGSGPVIQPESFADAKSRHRNIQAVFQTIDASVLVIALHGPHRFMPDDVRDALEILPAFFLRPSFCFDMHRVPLVRRILTKYDIFEPPCQETLKKQERRAAGSGAL